MGTWLQGHVWRRNIWKFITHPVTEIVALVVIVLVALATLISVESRTLRSPDAPVVFSPK